MAAEALSLRGFSVTVIDHMASPARKFLMAGRGGLNLTHSEPLERLLERYGAARSRLEPAIRQFPPEAIVAWCRGLGIETFKGSSGRIFPVSMKASPLLRAWLARLDRQGVKFRLRESWQGFDSTPTILALGGASWPRLGSTASWIGAFRAAGIRVNGFVPSNAGAVIPWSALFQEKFAGQPLKRIAIACEGETVRGEAVISRYGLEGGAVYALAPRIRNASQLAIDLRPDLSVEELAKKLEKPRGKMSQVNWLRKAAGLSPPAMAVLRETGLAPTAPNIKNAILPVHGLSGLARAISSAGGIDFSELDDNFQLRKRPGTYAIGEMLDWEAPTGGYLLQACFSMGMFVGTHFPRTN